MFNDQELFGNPEKIEAFRTFNDACASNPLTLALIEDMARASGTHPEQSHPETGVTYFSEVITVSHLVALPFSYFLYRWAKDHFDNRRALSNIEVAKRQAEFIEEMVASGFKREDAAKVSLAMFDGIGKAGQGTETLEKLASFLQKPDVGDSTSP